MLLTDVWMMLDRLNHEPASNQLLRPVAEFFGFKFSTKGTKNRKNTPQVAPMMAISGRPKPKEDLPAHIRNSPTFKKMFEDLERDNAG